MEWNHLPVAGGIYDQDPELIDAFETIFSVKSTYERQQQDREKRAKETKARKAAARKAR